jgi:hypothetical protein
MTSMTQSRHILKKSFPAKGDDGQIHEVHVYVKTASTDEMQRGAPIEKIDTVCLDDGTELHVVSKGNYEVVGSGAKLISSDRDAI